MKGEAFKTELATAYPDARLVVTKETMTVEGMIKIVYDLLKDKLNIAKLTFTSGVNAASQEYTDRKQIDRCPLCGISLDENEKEKFHFLERLVPLVERNYNLCELGPRGTGKSHIYKEISPYSILMSGGQTTTSNLFFNLQSKRVGLVGHWDCIAFDEVAGMRFRDMNTIQIMKDYMASGSFARGRDLVNADASMVFVGNINDSVENLLKVSHLFEPFPEEFHNDSAFFDRMHYYLPGWEVPKIRASFLTEEYGLITDCLAEFSREMRKRDLTHCGDQWFKLNRNITTRDEIAIRKTISGLVKLIYPDNSYTKDDLEIIITYAIEGRRSH